MLHVVFVLYCYSKDFKAIAIVTGCSIMRHIVCIDIDLV